MLLNEDLNVELRSSIDNDISYISEQRSSHEYEINREINQEINPYSNYPPNYSNNLNNSFVPVFRNSNLQNEDESFYKHNLPNDFLRFFVPIESNNPKNHSSIDRLTENDEIIARRLQKMYIDDEIARRNMHLEKQLQSEYKREKLHQRNSRSSHVQQQHQHMQNQQHLGSFNDEQQSSSYQQPQSTTTNIMKKFSMLGETAKKKIIEFKNKIQKKKDEEDHNSFLQDNGQDDIYRL